MLDKNVSQIEDLAKQNLIRILETKKDPDKVVFKQNMYR